MTIQKYTTRVLGCLENQSYRRRQKAAFDAFASFDTHHATTLTVGYGCAVGTGAALSAKSYGFLSVLDRVG